MRFCVLWQDIDIGGSDLESLDPPMGEARGVFIPSESYKQVQPVFRLFSEAIQHETGKFKEYYAARDALNLVLVTASGDIVPTDFIHIEDFSLELGEYGIQIVTADWATYERFFLVGDIWC